jgi:hypothetical protein
VSYRKGEAPFDLWSWVHLGSGAALGLVLASPLWAAGLLLLYEGFEALLRRIKTEEGGLFEYESWPNIAADVLVGLVGFIAVRLAFRFL